MPVRRAISDPVRPEAISWLSFSEVDNVFMGETIRERIYQGNTPPLLPADAGLAHTHNMVKPTDISERLAVLMRMRGVSQYALATMSGVPQPTIQRIISGETQNPKLKLCESLGKRSRRRNRLN